MADDLSGTGHGTIIIKKVHKGGHGGHHGGAWKVAYADMVTALMALFIVLWILSQSDEVVQNVAGYFRDPVGFRKGGAPTVMQGGGDAGQPTPLIDVKPIPDTAEISMRDVDRRWRIRAQMIRAALSKVGSFDKYRDQIELSITAEGLRISLIESNETPLFELGGTRLHSDARELLLQLGTEIKALHNHLAIEGHTDSRPFGSRSDMNNWELSTGRAHTAREVLERGGVDPKRMLEVRGLADRQLYNPLDPEDSRNRRVAITLLSEAAYNARVDQATETLLLEEVVE